MRLEPTSHFIISGFHSLLQAVSTIIWRPLKGHKYRAAWDVGHHWLGRLAFALGVASFFLGVYIAAVGWGWYVAYGATVGAFLILIGLKDIIDTLMVSKLTLCICMHPTQ